MFVVQLTFSQRISVDNKFDFLFSKAAQTRKNIQLRARNIQLRARTRTF